MPGVTVANAGELPYRITGAKKETVTDVTFDSAYVTGGEPITAAQLGLNKIDAGSVNCQIKTVAGTVNVTNVAYDETAKTLLAIDETPGEVASTADLSTLVVRVSARGY